MVSLSLRGCEVFFSESTCGVAVGGGFAFARVSLFGRTAMASLRAGLAGIDQLWVCSQLQCTNLAAAAATRAHGSIFSAEIHELFGMIKMAEALSGALVGV